MIIALDYDKTYEVNPDMWDSIIEMFQNWGCEVCLVTYRSPELDWTDLMTHLQDNMGVPVHCTNGVAKAWWMSHFGGDFSKIDVWIDDNPYSIIENSKASPEVLANWRAGHTDIVTEMDKRGAHG